MKEMKLYCFIVICMEKVINVSRKIQMLEYFLKKRNIGAFIRRSMMRNNLAGQMMDCRLE